MTEVARSLRIDPAGLSAHQVLGVLVLTWVAVLGSFYAGTVTSMVEIWWHSQTFAHGFLIAPIVLWLVWRQRHHLASQPIQTAVRVVPLVPLFGAVWWVAHRVDVQVVQQLSFVAMLTSGIWAIVGTPLARPMAFPLLFLFLAVPMGEGLVPPLRELTADTTELLIRISGIPVYRQGMFLSLPSGDWSVIEECSGVRYLVASFTLGLLYAWLTYQSLGRRLLFVLAAVAVPIAANSIRAYLTVLTGHFTDMKYGTGFDHHVFGWALFGVVMLALYWVGGIWRQPAQPAPVTSQDTAAKLGRGNLQVLSLVLFGALAWPLLPAPAGMPADLLGDPLKAPIAATGWSAAALETWPWIPEAEGADRQVDQLYRQDGGRGTEVAFFLRQYLDQTQGQELVSNDDVWRPDRHQWGVIAVSEQTARLPRTAGDTDPLSVTVREAVLKSGKDRFLAWNWYHVNGQHTANPYLAKWLETQQELLQGYRHGSRIFLATPIVEESARDASRARLQEFLDAHWARVNPGVDRNTVTDDAQEAREYP